MGIHRDLSQFEQDQILFHLGQPVTIGHTDIAIVGARAYLRAILTGVLDKKAGAPDAKLSAAHLSFLEASGVDVTTLSAADKAEIAQLNIGGSAKRAATSTSGGSPALSERHREYAREMGVDIEALSATDLAAFAALTFGARR